MKQCIQCDREYRDSENFCEIGRRELCFLWRQFQMEVKHCCADCGEVIAVHEHSLSDIECWRADMPATVERRWLEEL